MPLTGNKPISNRRQRRQRACEACKAQKVACDGRQPCAKCSEQGASCVYPRRTRPRRPSAGPSLGLHAPCFNHILSTITWKFSMALENGHMDCARAIKFLASWKMCHNVSGVDFSRGRCDQMLSLVSQDMSDQVTQQCLQMSPSSGDIRLYQLAHAQQCQHWRDMDDGLSCLAFMMYKEGHFTICCNGRFQHTFATDREAQVGYHEATIMPAIWMGKVVSSEDWQTYGELLAGTYFMAHHIGEGDTTAVLKCVDRHGASFLAVVRIQLMFFGWGGLGCWLLSVLPLPACRSTTQVDRVVPTVRHLPITCAIPSVPIMPHIS